MNCSIGIDLGGTNCRGALISSDGTILRRQRLETPRTTDAAKLLQTLSNLCRDLATGEIPSGVGIGVPGTIGLDGSVIMAPNLSSLGGLPLAEMLQMHLGLPVRVFNDVNAIAWGEALYGAARQVNSFICVALGTGVGGALVTERRLWLGSRGLAGELGHVTVVRGGRRCGCGNSGCLEAYASAGGLLRNAQLAGRSGLTDGPLAVARLAREARAGEPSAIRAFEQAGRLLGQALAGIVALLDPELILFCGGVSESFELLQPALEQELWRRCRTGAADGLQLVCGSLGDDAGILGVSALASQQV